MTLNSLDFSKPPHATRIVVAMSGGVDSSVVAAMLHRDGYDVVGVTLKLYDDGSQSGRKGTCCAGRDIADARGVAAKLGVPHYTFDYEERFRKAVIEPFAESYRRGETPIPCASCNNAVKFTDLLGAARELGADALATGHYCATRLLADGRRGLFRGADPTRDQSYFLFGTTRDQLDYLRFPLGDLPKTAVRSLAREFGLQTADKPDSQDICFVAKGHYADFLSRFESSAASPGEIVDDAGRVLGRHNGVSAFTLGQRRGLNLSGFPEPLFVTNIDAENARVTVGPSEALRVHSLPLRDVNWLGDGDQPPRSARIHVKCRSMQQPAPAVLSREQDGFVVSFTSASRAVAPGQACVFYESDESRARVLGGGTVVRSSRESMARAPTQAAEPALLT